MHFINTKITINKLLRCYVRCDIKSKKDQQNYVLNMETN